MKVGVKAIPYNHALRHARVKAGLKQSELARRVGMHQNTYSLVERLCRAVTEQQAVDIAMELGRSIDELFPAETQGFKTIQTRTVDFAVEIESLDELPEGELGLMIGDLDEAIDQQDLIAAIRQTLGTLPNRERKVLELRFGIPDGIEHSVREIADLVGVSRSRIHQIESKAMKQMRHPVRVQALRDYID